MLKVIEVGEAGKLDIVPVLTKEEDEDERIQDKNKTSSLTDIYTTTTKSGKIERR